MAFSSQKFVDRQISFPASVPPSLPSSQYPDYCKLPSNPLFLEALIFFS